MREVPQHLIKTPSDEAAVQQGCWFDQSKADRVKDFLNQFCRLSVPPWNGKPIQLLDWQHEFIDTVYGWQGDFDGRLERRFNRVRFSCGKKQGKSTLLSSLLLYHLFEQERADCLIVAGTKEQAKIIYDETYRMIEAHPVLSKRLWLRRSALAIEDKKRDARARIISSEPRNAAGHNPSFLVADEIASWGAYARETWSHLEPAGIARQNFLQIVIGHAGFEVETVGHELFRYAKELQEGTIIDPRTWGKVFTVPTDPPDAWKKEEYWHHALPSLGKTVTMANVRQQFHQCENNPAKEAEFRTLMCNQFVGSAEAWLSQISWDNLGDKGLSEDDFQGEACVVGIDASKTTDLTCYVKCFARDGKFYVFPKFFMPEEQAQRRTKEDKVPYRSWPNLVLTPGDVIDPECLISHLVEDSFRFQFMEVAYDSYGFELIRQRLEYDYGMPMVEIPQTSSVMPELIEQTHRQIEDKKLVHPNCSCLNWCISNTKPRIVRDDKVMLEKCSDRSRIDGTIAMVMAVGRSVLLGQTGLVSLDW
ncbi:terminase large subunit [Bremerella sp. P1]|uniref:terminase large subunit n=1 Tax=Bremerella sp. P1 TaxID=3026424 RepID=UPI0023680228|nr:terminase TerL endonuclease subunit [Bremerella sp. P1]WDI41833.1 terminase large subunit [Bremerella sp. P1]